MIKQRPSVFRILITDYLAFLALLFPIVIWPVYFFGRSGQDETTFYTAIVITIIAIPVLIWRIYYFIKMFDTGVESSAVVQGLSFYRSRGRVEYTYTFQGTQYAGRDVVNKFGRVKDLHPTQQITILVDPGNPKQAIIRKLYL
jgi:hypothetical protein